MDIPSLFMIPSAVSSGKVHSVFPNSTDADFDFNRDSDATRVNSEGLIERVGYYGSELVTNGGFDSASGWNLNTNWTISNGVASCDGTNSNDINQNQNVGVIGKSYRISFTIVSISQGGIAARIGSGVTNYYTEAGTYTEIVTATSTDRIRVSVQGNAIASVDNLSIKEVTGDRARLNYEIEGGLVNTKPSLLLEPQSTNLLPYSNDISTYSNFGSTDTLNAAISPEGINNAHLFSGKGDYNQVFLSSQSITLGSAGSYSISVFAKKGTNNFIYLGADSFTGATNNFAYFDLENGTTPTSGANIESYGNGWFRCSTVVTIDAGDLVGTLAVRIPPSTSTIFWSSANAAKGKNVYVYGFQFEQQSYLTSHIPTNGSTQTRAAETCNGAGTSSILPSEEGILYCEIAALANDGTFREITLNDGTTSNAIEIRYITTSNSLQYVARSGGGVTASYAHTFSNATEFVKAALSYKANNFKMYLNGSLVATDTSGATPVGLNRLNFNWGGFNFFYGKTRDIRVYNTKEMTDSEVDILLTKITS